MMRKILLVGGSGYVGTVITSHLLKKGYMVNVLDNFVYNNQFASELFLGEPNYKFFLGDLGNASDLKTASEGVTDVVLLGGLVGDPITKSYPDESKMINDEGVTTCINYFNSKGLDKFILISTCSNYGLIKDNEVADENFELNPLSLYAKAKVKAENTLISKKGTTDFTGVVLRFATAFGLSPRMRFDLSVSEFTKDLYFGEILKVFDEHTWRPYCHVRDFARLIEIVLNAEKNKVYFEIFNAGGDKNNCTKKMIVDEIVNNIPTARVEYGANGSDPRNYKVSFEKVRNNLNFIPEYSVKDGIKELVSAFKNGFFHDAVQNKNKYGNYLINYKSKI
jgi:nucleoside-diphosphate-sugar epimerase